MRKSNDPAPLPSTGIGFLLRLHDLIAPPSDQHMAIGLQVAGGIPCIAFDPHNPQYKTSWTHMSTGLFELPDQQVPRARRDRSTNRLRQITRSGARFKGCWGMILDDVGTAKVPNIPDLPPTFKVQTRPGSEQWGYVFDKPLTDWDEAGFILGGLVAAGYTDNFITSCIHLFRFPGSKPYDKDHMATLLVWNGNTYSKQDFITGMGITLQPHPGGHRNRAEDVLGSDPKTAAADPLWRYVVRSGLAEDGRLSSSGWANVTCPNAANHSNPQSRPWGRYHPASSEGPGVFMCFHEHCTGANGPRVTTETFQNWIYEQPMAPTADEVDAHADACRDAFSASYSAVMPAPPQPPKKPEHGPLPPLPEPDSPHAPGSLAALMALDLPPQVPVVEGWLFDGTMNLFFARQKAGKSYMLLDLIEAVASGKPFLDRPTSQGRVLMMPLEDGIRRVQHRIGLRKMDPALFAQIDVVLEEQLPPERTLSSRLKALTERLVAAMQQGRPYKLVTIDTRTIFEGIIDTKMKDMNAYQRDVSIMRDITKIARATGVCIVITSHNKKGTQGMADFMDAASGSLGQTATADTIWTINRKAGSNTAIMIINGRDLEGEESLTIQHMPDTRWQALDVNPVVAEVLAHAKDRTGGTSCTQWLLNRLTSKESVPRAVLREECPYDATALRMTTMRMKAKGAIIEDAGGLRLPRASE